MQLSPNFGQRRIGSNIDIIILHYTGMSDGQKACDWLCNPESQVSSHYLINDDGTLVQMVDETARAWHAGVSSWHGVEDINSTSIGIEIQNPGHSMGYPEFPLVQMEAVAALCADLLKRYNIKPRNILAHSDIAPGRKIDPGEKFDWFFLHQRGIGHWVAPEPLLGGSYLQVGDHGDPVMALQALLKLYGYGLEANGTFDPRTKIVVEAFQRHFRQIQVDGVADQSTVATLHKLLRR
ncbi:MAG: N-acetylmuramoyl-L-alanine amidase [Alphaproteobacteria bacterium]|nr:N-acetylmuramoyl-L-alanine amidase [Alphaproteobacteria bacterium]